MKRMAPMKKVAMTKAEFTKLFDKLKAIPLTPEQIATELGVNRVTLYRWASGARKIDLFTDVKLG